MVLAHVFLFHFDGPERGQVAVVGGVKNALSINEIEWVKIFIEEYVLKLRSAHRESMRALGYSYLYFKLKDYNKVLENLSKVKFTDVRLKINTKSLYLLTFYELNDVEGLLYHIDSAKHFIINNASVNDWNKKNYIEFLNRCFNKP